MKGNTLSIYVEDVISCGWVANIAWIDLTVRSTAGRKYHLWIKHAEFMRMSDLIMADSDRLLALQESGSD